MPPRSKPSDYTKGKLTQDEIIALQIANDANIAKARKAIKMGEVPQSIDPINSMSPEEAVLDDATQEAETRKNLEKLGFRPQEASAITTTIRNDNQLFFRDFNRNFPAIEADIKKRFNPKLITPAFFVEYFRQYTNELNQAIGVKVFQPYNAGLNGMINNVAELRQLLPPPAIIMEILGRAQQQYGVNQDVLGRLNQLAQMLPTEQGLRALENLDPVRQQRVIDELLDQFRDLPPAEEFMALRGMIRGDQIDREDFRLRMRDIVDAIPQGRQENIVNVELNLAGVRDIVREELARLPRQPSGKAGRYEDESSLAQESKSGVADLFGNEELEEELRGENRRAARLEADRQRARDFLEAESAFALALRRGEIKTRQLKSGANVYYDAATGTEVRSPDFNSEAPSVKNAILEMRPRGQFDMGELSSMTGTTAESGASYGSSSVLDTNFTLKALVATIRANNLSEDIRAIVNTERYNVGDKINPNDLAKTPPKAGAKGNKIYFDDTNIRELMRQRFGSGIKPIMGQGVMNRYRYLGQGVNPEPRPRVIVGKGIAVKETPSYKQYGKYAIHIPQLEQQDILNVKYKSLGQVPKFKPMPVSDIFRDFMLDLLENGKPNQRVYHQIAPQERKIFEEMSIGAGVWNGLGLKRTTTSTDEEEAKRFELLKGEYMAGNNNPKVISELRRLVVKMMSDGRIRKAQGLELLMELSI